MKKIFHISFLLIFTILSSKSQVINNRNIKIIEFTGVGYGKLSQSPDRMSLLTKATKINKKYFSSAVYRKDTIGTICYPIDDRVFNHEFFNGFDYNPQRKIKLYLKKYTYRNEEYLIAVKIE